MSRYREQARRVARYALVGGGAWVLDLALFLVFWPVIGVLPAQVLARLLGAIAAFFGHKLWVFGHPDLRTPVVARQGLGYALLWLLSLALSLSVLAALTQGLGVAPLAAKLFTEAVVLILNFSVLRHLIFRHRPGDRPGGRGRAPVVTAKCLP